MTDRSTVTDEAGDRQDRLSQAVDALTPSSLVGSFFHSCAETGWQGCVVAEPVPGVYLVELFSWFMGESTNQCLIPIDRMVSEGWQFYDTAEWMKNTYEHGLDTQWKQKRESRAS